MYSVQLQRRQLKAEDVTGKNEEDSDTETETVKESVYGDYF